MIRDLSIQAIFMGILAATVGFASTFAVVLQGVTQMGASPAEASSGLIAVSLAMGICALGLSLWYRMPISVAWSTPAAALLATSAAPEGGFPVAIGAFVVSGVLLTLAGLWRPLSRGVSKIPASIANAMLAGILVGLCLAPFKAIAFDPVLGLPIFLAWLVGNRINRFLGVPLALLAFVVVTFVGVDLPESLGQDLTAAAKPELIFVMPEFTLAGVVGIGVPVFLVTMASQNIPGAAVLAVNGYKPNPSPLFATSGFFALISAPFGSLGVNLAAITAAMCAGEDAHPDPAKRYWAGATSGIVYIAFGAFAGIAATFLSAAPPILIQAVAGLALIGAFIGSVRQAFQEEGHRDAAAVTFLATASGISLFGISGAFWGLLAGLVLLGIKQIRARGN